MQNQKLIIFIQEPTFRWTLRTALKNDEVHFLRTLQRAVKDKEKQREFLTHFFPRSTPWSIFPETFFFCEAPNNCERGINYFFSFCIAGAFFVIFPFTKTENLLFLLLWRGALVVVCENRKSFFGDLMYKNNDRFITYEDEWPFSHRKCAHATKICFPQFLCMLFWENNDKSTYFRYVCFWGSAFGSNAWETSFCYLHVHDEICAYVCIMLLRLVVIWKFLEFSFSN